MDDDNSRQEEARRILDAIRHKESEESEDQEPPKPISHIPEEDAKKLKALVAQKFALKNEDPASAAEESLPDPESIDPISTEQIKVMRQVATVKGDEKRPFTTVFFESLIKAYFSLADAFKMRQDNTPRECYAKGHECMHCGQRIPPAAVEFYAKAIKNKEVPPNSNLASTQTSDNKPL